MELWIRSQDKEKLIKSENFKYGFGIYGHIILNGEIILGEYKSKERALEILDEIQNILKPKILAHIRPSEEMEELLGGLRIGKTMKMKKEFEFKELSTYVYEMPKE